MNTPDNVLFAPNLGGCGAEWFSVSQEAQPKGGAMMSGRKRWREGMGAGGGDGGMRGGKVAQYGASQYTALRPATAELAVATLMTWVGGATVGLFRG